MTSAMTAPLERAVAFAAMTNRGGVQAWMLWAGWAQHVGCYQCAGEGREAECWGVEGCHGFENDCGCIPCVALETDELQAGQARLALAADLERPFAGALRDELALVDAQIGEPTDGRAG